MKAKLGFIQKVVDRELAGKLVVFVLTVLLLATTLSTVLVELVNPMLYAAGEVANYTVRAPRDIVVKEEIAAAGTKPTDAKKTSFTHIKRGEVVVRAGDVISEKQEQRLRQIRGENDAYDSFQVWSGYVLLTGIVLLTIYAFAVRFWPGYDPSTKDLALQSLTLLGSFFLFQLASLLGTSLSTTFFYFEPGTFMLATPVAAGGILLQVILGAPAVTTFLLAFAVLTGVFLENSWIFLVLIVLGNMIGASAAKTCCRRSVFIRAGFRVALINVLIVSAFFLLFGEHSYAEKANRVIWAIVGGLFSGILAAGITPIIEFLGRYTTDMKLLELSSLDHPLLRELSLQAPGTWNHSVVVGQMAEAAAESIGANPLLARVGAYYHDVGKSRYPAYFVENQIGENRHDKLTPSMSALIIKSHVKDGIELAETHRLPQAVINMIPQHHGTSLIEYFFEKANKEAEEEEVVEEQHFRYSGPKPQSKEAGILMLADSVEASSRTLSDPSPAKIQGLVQKIINKVFASGELDESTLTLKDLHHIAKNFVRILTGIYHRRVEYSESAEKIRESKERKETESAKIQEINLAARRSSGRGHSEGDAAKRAEQGAGKEADSGERKETLRRLGMSGR